MGSVGCVGLSTCSARQVDCGVVQGGEEPWTSESRPALPLGAPPPPFHLTGNIHGAQALSRVGVSSHSMKIITSDLSWLHAGCPVRLMGGLQPTVCECTCVWRLHADPGRGRGELHGHPGSVGAVLLRWPPLPALCPLGTHTGVWVPGRGC